MKSTKILLTITGLLLSASALADPTWELDLTTDKSWGVIYANMMDDSAPFSKVIITLPPSGIRYSVEAIEGDDHTAACLINSRIMNRRGQRVLRITMTPELGIEDGSRCILNIMRTADGKTTHIEIEQIGT